MGAAGVLIRSLGTGTHRFAHTGATRYEEGIPQIPAAALAVPDADILSTQVDSGKPVRFRLELGATRFEDVKSANVIGEIIGRDRPEEIVLLGAHLDSWDKGTGATYYFDYHHTDDDTLDKVDPDALAQNVAAYSVVAYWAAEREGLLGRPAIQKAAPSP